MENGIMICIVSISGDDAPSRHVTPDFSSSARWGCRVCPPAAYLRGTMLTADPYCKQTWVKKVEKNQRKMTRNSTERQCMITESESYDLS